MAPMTRARTRAEPKPTKKPTRTHYKKQQQVINNKSKNVQKEAPKTEDLKIEELSAISTTPCSTPKAQKFQIPKIENCPPAPKKQRVIPNLNSLQRRPIAFFAPPDLELFFFFALGDHISL